MIAIAGTERQGDRETGRQGDGEKRRTRICWSPGFSRFF
jgi:hypothetical protein